MSASDNMKIDFSFEEEISEEESGVETQQTSSMRETRRNKRLLFQEFRAQALQREIHERYAPLRPSPLRNEIDPADLPNPEIPDGETIDDLQSDNARPYDGTESDSDGAERSNRAGSSSGSSSDEWDESEGLKLRRQRRVGNGAEEDRCVVIGRSMTRTSPDPEWAVVLRLMMGAMVVAGPRRCTELKCGLGKGL